MLDPDDLAVGISEEYLRRKEVSRPKWGTRIPTEVCKELLEKYKYLDHQVDHRLKRLPTKPKKKLLMAKNPKNPEELDLLRRITADPIAVLQEELARALTSEININRTLYSEGSVDSRAISDSNKRMMDLADALKALPKQHDVTATLSQKSSAELLHDALKSRKSAPKKYDDDLEQRMLARANDGFGDE